MNEKEIANYWYMKGVKDAETTERQPVSIEETLRDFETHFELQYAPRRAKYLEVAIMGSGPTNICKEAIDLIQGNRDDLFHPYKSSIKLIAEAMQPLTTTRLPVFKEPYISPEEFKTNYKKHEETCAKNRKKRKAKKK
jgi:hypothetical protein